MKYLIFCFLSLVASVSCSGCTTKYDPILVWANNKQYNNVSSLPFVLSDYSAMKRGTGISDNDLENKRIETVNWLEEGFGIPKNIAEYNVTSRITVYPGLGQIIPVFFIDSYELVSSSVPSYSLVGCYHLAVVEFSWFFDSSISFTYGGKFGQLIDIVGGSKQAVSSDSVAVGYYYIQRTLGTINQNIKRVEYKSVLPNRNDFSWRAHQYMKLNDSEWGTGYSIMERSLYVDYSSGKLVSQILNSWKFDEANDIYAAAGISV